MKSHFSKGDPYSRNEYCYLISTELRRTGVNKEKALDKIVQWNSFNNPPLSHSELRSCLKSAYSKNFTYGCNREILQEYCKYLGGKENCFYYKKISKSKRNFTEDDYINTGLQKILTSRECLILFFVIPFIERKRGLYPGSWLAVPCRELEYISGINKRYFSHDKNNKNILDRLRENGLIEYKPGKQHIWNKEANLIKRIIPIPNCKQEK